MADQARNQLPTKPHFLQPVISDLATNFSIPADFCKYLEGERCEEAQLRSRRRRRPWAVRIEGRRMVDGWEDFVRENELHVGEFLVFRYEGDMVFDVTVFDPTAVEREYPPLPEDDSMVEEDGGTLELVEKSGTKRRRSYRSILAGADSYVGTMRPSYMKHLYFPIPFILENQLKEASSGILIIDEKGKTWPVGLCFKRESNVVYTKKGVWRSFVKECEIRQGEDFEVRVISRGRKPVLSFRRLSKNDNEDENTHGIRKKAEEVSEVVPEAEETGGVVEPPATSRSEQKPDSDSTCFYQTSTWPSIERSRMIVNIEFARANDLASKCGNIALKNQKGETWAAKLRYEKKRTQECYYIGAGWKQFALSNGLGVGCRFKMEMERPESKVLTFNLCECTPGELKLEGNEHDGQLLWSS